ncbi:ADP-ribose pyrophosphatase [Pelagirhabdus alkalitolerans]|uniref:ADP-ribose pyrophosphatase n=1 Tax=Pelagirhabdus alkalitolerans TaxID=1612202 RepID=A0A1G6HBY7_9BACI|nr:NUDIX hydrolase [Pelagirhabdus alkalitolerans]SDB91817.1 ADP-ribose pyrophosphatase [Pelagirhabdus alkalitolerans]
MDQLEEKTINTKHIYKGAIIDVTVDDVQLPNGEQSKRELVKHPGAVAVIALTDDNKLLMVKQYRKPMESSSIEIPAGKLEEGEEPILTARRELEEETGYTTDQLHYITSFYSSPGFSDEYLHLYWTDQVTKLEIRPDLDEDEFVELYEADIAQIDEWIKKKEIQDLKTLFAVQYLKLNK